MTNLRNLRTKKGVSQQTVANHLGITRQAYNNYELGKRQADYETLLKLGEYFEVSVEELLRDKPPENPPVESNAVILDSSNIYMRPVFESVSAGFGAYASNDIVEYMPIYIENPYDVDDTICVKVKGNSMYPKIENGDRIVIRKQSIVDSGKIAVVRIGDEAVVKKVEYDDLSQGLTLISINPEYPPRTLSGDELENAAIVGLVQQVIKAV
jgi:repressor LexA